MCGRLNIVDDPLCRLVTEQLGLAFHAATNQDLRPTQEVQVVSAAGAEMQQLTTHWGIQPNWAKRLLINAQAETVASKPTFKRAFAEHRCLVPCSGWYEWQAQAGQARKTKFLFHEAAGMPLYMAGIFYPSADGAQLVTLTTAPTEQCATYHHRMPLLIRPSEAQFWLRSRADELDPLLVAPSDIELAVVTAG